MNIIYFKTYSLFTSAAKPYFSNLLRIKYRIEFWLAALNHCFSHQSSAVNLQPFDWYDSAFSRRAQCNERCTRLYTVSETIANRENEASSIVYTHGQGIKDIQREDKRLSSHRNFLRSGCWLTSQVFSSLEFGSGYTSSFFLFRCCLLLSFHSIPTLPSSTLWHTKQALTRGPLVISWQVFPARRDVSFGTSWKFDDESRS